MKLNVTSHMIQLLFDLYTKQISQPLELHFGDQILSWVIIIATLMPRELC